MSARTILKQKRGGARYVRRKSNGQFGKQEGVGRSLAQDRRRKAKTVAKKGQGDRGDHRRSK